MAPANAAQIWSAVSTDASNTMATLAPLAVKHIRAALAPACIRCVRYWTIHDDEDGEGTAEEEDTGAHSASERASHVQSILSKMDLLRERVLWLSARAQVSVGKGCGRVSAGLEESIPDDRFRNHPTDANSSAC